MSARSQRVMPSLIRAERTIVLSCPRLPAGSLVRPPWDERPGSTPRIRVRVLAMTGASPLETAALGRSPSEANRARHLLAVSSLLVSLENEAIQALARHYYSRGGSPIHGSSSARALRMASSVSCAWERWGICRRYKTDSPSSTAQKRMGKSST
jgi:hypothetical protein